MIISQISPVGKKYDIEALIAALKLTSCSQPFSADIINTCADFSRALLHDSEAQRYDELKILAFFMRKAALLELRQSYERLLSEQNILVPRGLVFHIPPGNVDTIFVYSWLLSVLAGNANIIRLPTKESNQLQIMCRLLNECLQQSVESIKNSNLVISYGHDENVTKAISQMSDVRVIWGGDTTIETVRKIPVAPHTKEIVFPNRYSYAVIKASGYLKQEKTEREMLAHDFFKDAFGFDQLGCSSPRILIWCGDFQETESASLLFWQALQEQIRNQQYTLPVGNVLRKISDTYRAVLDGPVVRYRSYGNELTVLEIDNMEKAARHSIGMGFFSQYCVSKLGDIIPSVKKCDQTLTYFGFSKDELLVVAQELNGKGIDRIVPIGQALSFNRFWDGYDLICEFFKVVYIS